MRQWEHHLGGTMLNFEGPDEGVPTTIADGGPVDGATTAPATDHQSQTSAPRMLELAAVTADRLVADARSEAAGLVSNARAEAEAILGASRTEADRVTAELTRTRAAQTAELDRERATAMGALAADKAGLEAQIATLRQLQSDHRRQLRDHLTRQLSLLDKAVPKPPTDALG